MVAFVGIAATTFLLTLQPALAGASDILGRQMSISLPPGFNASSLQSCTSCLAVFPVLANSSCTQDQSCLCNASVANNLQSCMQCAVGLNVINQGNATAEISVYNSSCNTATTTTAPSTGSKMSIGTFGVVITAVLGAVALL